MHCKEPGEHFAELAVEFGAPYYARVDTAVTPGQKARSQKLSPDSVKALWRRDYRQAYPRPRNQCPARPRRSPSARLSPTVI